MANIKSLIDQKKYRLVAKSFSGTAGRRTRQIFHTAHFYLTFTALTFFVITSSNSLFGRGIVLGFCLSLLVTKYFDFRDLGNLDHWFDKLGLRLDKKQQKWYLIASLAVLLIFGLLV